MYMAVVMATARTLGEAEPLAQPGSGFAFLVQQHPAHPVVLAQEQPTLCWPLCHCHIPSTSRGQ